ncbi:hypothetical protein BDZ97DRAFT_1924318 [Flammula alnicola]|nr:hypothetical protein BDZ97DRAFT_1924318 [Flammula alnicola]
MSPLLHTLNPAEAETIYKQILSNTTDHSIASTSKEPPHGNDHVQGLHDQEVALLKLGELYRDQKNAQGLADVITQSRAFISSTAKAKTAKLIRTLLDYFNSIPGSQNVQMKTPTDNIGWAKSEKRIFLKHSLETWLTTGNPTIQTCSNPHQSLLTKLKRLDDKIILTEVHLLESRVYRGIGSLAKAEPSPLQEMLLIPSTARLSSILHAEDKDYTTAYSYFFEAFENLSAQGEESALGALKYMLLCKVMLNLPEDVDSLLTIRLALKYANMRDKALRDYKEVVEIAYVAETVGQERQAVEAKLSQMILDKVFYGVLNQGRGCLIVYDQPEADNTYGAAIKTLAQVRKVVESLYAKTVRIA